MLLGKAFRQESIANRTGKRYINNAARVHVPDLCTSETEFSCAKPVRVNRYLRPRMTSSSSLFRCVMSRKPRRCFFDARDSRAIQLHHLKRCEGRPSRNQIPLSWLCALVRPEHFLPGSDREPIEICQTDSSVHPLAPVLFLGRSSEIRKISKMVSKFVSFNISRTGRVGFISLR